MVDTNFAKRHKLPTVELAKAIKLELANGSFADNITHAAKIEIMRGEHKEQMWSLIGPMPGFDMILGVPWLEEHNPDIDYGNRVMTFSSRHCCANCNPFFETVSVTGPGSKLRKKNPEKKASSTPNPYQDTDINHLSAYAFLKTARRKDHEVVAMWPEHFEALNKPAEQDKYLLASAFTTRIAAMCEDISP